MSEVERKVPSLDRGRAQPIVLRAGAEQAALDPIPLRIRRGQALFREGDPVTSIYRVHAGDFKLVRAEEDGFERVVDVVEPDEIIGLESLQSLHFRVTAIALEDSLIHAVPLDRLRGVVRPFELFEDRIRDTLAAQFERLLDASWLLSSVGADRRTARYLVLLSRRMVRRGLSPTRFVLRMRRREISSYIGLCHESVSRAFATLARLRLLQVQGRQIEILDLPGLERFADVNRSRLDGTASGVAPARMVRSIDIVRTA